MGQSLWTAFKKLEVERTKVGHAFLYSENPLEGHADIIAERLEAEERAGTRRSGAVHSPSLDGFYVLPLKRICGKVRGIAAPTQQEWCSPVVGKRRA
jgi:hypothetical protein